MPVIANKRIDDKRNKIDDKPSEIDDKRWKTDDKPQKIDDKHQKIDDKAPDTKKKASAPSACLPHYFTLQISLQKLPQYNATSPIAVLP